METGNEKAKKSFFGVSKSAALATAAIAGVGAASFKSAMLASDYNESLNVIEQSLGDMSDEAVKWAETSIEAMGISQTTALKTAGVYASMAKGMGMTNEEAFELSTTLVQLSADMASFYNISQERAALALAGIFTGETEALRRLGVNIDAATLATYGYDQSMSQAEKTMIRYNAVLDQTTHVQGDFARTSDELAGQVRMLKEQFIELGTQIGFFLIPLFTTLITTLNDVLTFFINLITGTSTLSGEFQILGIFVENLRLAFELFKETIIVILETLNPFIEVIKVLIEQFSKLAAILIGALIPILESLHEIFQRILIALQPLIEAIASFLIPVLKILGIAIGVIIQLFAKLAEVILKVVTPILEGLANFISVILTPVFNVLAFLLESLIYIFATLADVIKSVLTPVLEFLQGIIEDITSAFDFLVEKVNTLVDVLKNFLAPAIEFINDLLAKLFDFVNAVGEAFGRLGSSITNAFNSIPFLPDFNTSFAAQPANLAGAGIVNNAGNVYNYNIQTSKKMTVKEAKRQKILFEKHGGKYANKTNESYK